jgi:hypothetical protein
VIVLPFLLRNSRYRLSIIFSPPPSRLGTRTVPFIQAPNEACVREFLIPGNLQMQAPFSIPHGHQNNQKISSLTQPALIRDWCRTPTWGIRLLSRTGLRLFSSFTFSKLFPHNMYHFSNSNNWLVMVYTIFPTPRG